MLFCFAHPDDESFSGAGVAMKYAETGVRSVLVTATRGERGKVGDPPVCTPEELPACREHELRNALAIIGIAELHLLGYRDRELADSTPARSETPGHRHPKGGPSVNLHVRSKASTSRISPIPVHE